VNCIIYRRGASVAATSEVRTVAMFKLLMAENLKVQKMVCPVMA
jgi:hypothetical protein